MDVLGTPAAECQHMAHLLLRRGWGCLLLLLLLRGGGDPRRQLLEVGGVHARPGRRRRRQLHGRRSNTVKDGRHCHISGLHCASRRWHRAQYIKLQWNARGRSMHAKCGLTWLIQGVAIGRAGSGATGCGGACCCCCCCGCCCCGGCCCCTHVTPRTLSMDPCGMPRDWA